MNTGHIALRLNPRTRRLLAGWAAGYESGSVAAARCDPADAECREREWHQWLGYVWQQW